MPQARRLFWWIAFSVISVHLALLMSALWGFSSKFTPKSPQRLIVRTVTLNPHVTTVSTNSSPDMEIASVAPKRIDPDKTTPASTTAAPKKPDPKPSKTPTKPKPAKKSTSTPQTTQLPDDKKTTPALDPQKLALLAEAKEKMAKIRSTQQAAQPNTVSSKEDNWPKLPVALQSDAASLETKGLAGPELTYQEELIGRLKLLLRLPEYGLVQLKLTLERSGKVKQITILSAESSKNKNYIEKTLPTLSFPAFGNNFAGQETFTFPLTLSNEL